MRHKEGGENQWYEPLAHTTHHHPSLPPSLQTPSLIAYSGYTEADILPCATLLSKWIHETTQTQSKRLLNAVKKKFATSKWAEITEADHLRLPVTGGL